MMEPLEFTFGACKSFIRFEDSVKLSDMTSRKDTVTVFDLNTYSLFGKDTSNPVVLNPGESSKCWQSVEKIIRKAVHSGLGRDGVIIGVGGGVICDLASFSASIYMRGCRLVLIPTSLLAMVDAAIGGKTGININSYKNMAGTFYPAEEICLFIKAIKSLPFREYKAGLAEAIKTAMIGDADLFNLLSEKIHEIMDRQPQILKEIIHRCIIVKGRVVEQDFREAGKRAILNLGHTFAHALEAVSGFKHWNHGEAVAWGLAKAVELGERIGVTEKGYAHSVKKILSDYEYRLETGGSISASELIQAMHADKKKRGGMMRLVIQRGICDTFLEHIEDGQIRAILS